MRWTRLGGAATITALTACSLVTSLDGYTGGATPAEGGDRDVEAATPPDSPPDAAPLDAADGGGPCDGGGLLRGGLCLPEPFAHWALDEGAGTTITRSGKGGTSTGKIHGGATWTAGHVGPWALAFDGVDGYVDLGPTPELSFGASSFTYGLLLFLPANVGAYDLPWVKGGGGVTSPGFDMEIGTNGWGAGVTEPAHGLVASFGTPIFGQWVRLVVVVDRSTEEVRPYMNGVLGGARSIAGWGPIAPGSTVAYLGSNSTSNFVKGKIDDVLVFDRALSPAEVQALDP